MNSRLRYGVALSALMFGLTDPEFGIAQTAPGSVPAGSDTVAPTAPANSSGQAASGGVPEIVVTAEKRSNSINRVGLTMQAFSGDALTEMGVSSVQDLTKIVPGLEYTESPSSTPVYTLRGVGFYETSLAAYPDVTVYVDQVPLQFPALTPQAGLDLERVEVLKGPQGILFGQNATGGAINYIAAKPTKEFEAGLNVGYGSYNRVSETGFVSGPLTDNLTARFSFKAENGDAWQYSYTNPGQKNGSLEDYVGRILLDWVPTDRLKVEINMNGWINKSQPEAGQYFNFSPQILSSTTALNTLSAIPYAPSNDRAANWAFPLRGDDSMYQFAINGSYAITDDLTATSISSYINYAKNDVDTNSGLAIPDEEAPLHTGFIRTFTQELRFANGSDNRFRWTAGGNYENSHIYEYQLFYYSASTLAEAFDANGNNFYSDQHVENYAGFANGEFDILPDLTVKAGTRYTQSDRSFTGCGADFGDGLFDALFGGISSELTGTHVVIPEGSCAVLNQYTFLPGVFQANLDQHNLSWRTGIDYHVLPSTLLYMNVAKGYKSGGFPTLGAATSKQYQPVTQESVIDYEGGIKTQLFDRRLSVTAAGFYYDYTDKQVRTKLIDPIFGIIDALANVPKSDVKGAELSATTRPFEGLELTASTTWLDTTVQNYTGVNGQGVEANFAGTPLPFSPKWQVAGIADYRWDVLDGYFADVGATLTYHTQTFAVVGGGDVSEIDPYTLLDLRASLSTPDDKWRLSFIGRNVTNKYYWTNVVHVYDTSVRYPGQPATFGAILSYKF